jgi:pilus assembly protein CpaC
MLIAALALAAALAQAPDAGKSVQAVIVCDPPCDPNYQPPPPPPPPPPPQAPPTLRTMPLGIGTQRVINVPGVSRVEVSDPSVAELRPLGKQLLITGKKVGQSMLTLWREGKSPIRNLLIVRTNGDRGYVHWDFKKLLGPSPGLSVRVEENRSYLEGRFTGLEELERAAALLHLFGELVSNLARIDPKLLQGVADLVNADLEREGISRVRAVLQGDGVALQGELAGEAEMMRARNIAEPKLGALREAVEALRQLEPPAARP